MLARFRGPLKPGFYSLADHAALEFSEGACEALHKLDETALTKLVTAQTESWRKSSGLSVASQLFLS